MGALATIADTGEIGYFRIFATAPGGTRREITFFRGAPIQVSGITTQDPFTDAAMSISCPQITAWDTPGSGDLDWLVPYSLIDVIWQNTNGHDYRWSFEGYVASMSTSVDESSSGVSLDVKGALLLLDNYLAAPEFPSQPIPYEYLMDRVFDQKLHPAYLAPFSIEWPTIPGWDKRVPTGKEYEELYRYAALRPWGVQPGQRWTGFTTRSTGSWEPLLTGFAQGLLSVMFEEGGHQWSIRKDDGRKPVLYLRETATKDDPDLLSIDLGTPGVTVNFSRDFTQSANIIYGAGQDTAGSTFSGANVSSDGQRTFYTPFAHQPSVWPVDPSENGARNAFIVPKEAHIKFPSGMDFADAESLSRAQLHRFADPGFTGTITLKTDPRRKDGSFFPRMLIKAGQNLLLRGMMGTEVIFHVSNASIDISDQVTVTLTVDSKYRDQLTVAEVQSRTRDALTPLRSLQIGSYTNTINDLLLPWSYAQGSGIIPSGNGGKDATEFFLKHLPSTAKFPYEEFTKKYPPKSTAGAGFYIKLGKADKADARNNWATRPGTGSAKVGWPIRMSQAGTTRLVQIAAYKADGSVFPVRFHVSLYANSGVNPDAMPKFPAKNGVISVPYLKPPGGDTYKPGQPNPFFRSAWEQVNEDGTGYQNATDVTADGSDVIVGYGTYYEPAGYWPGRPSRGDQPTGLLVDESSWSWDMSADPNFDKQATTQSKITGYIYAMIYCDYQGPEDVYFMGRIYRQETQ